MYIFIVFFYLLPLFNFVFVLMCSLLRFVSNSLKNMMMMMMMMINELRYVILNNKSKNTSLTVIY